MGTANNDILFVHERKRIRLVTNALDVLTLSGWGFIMMRYSLVRLILEIHIRSQMIIDIAMVMVTLQLNPLAPL